jgi:hypothetical protein
VRGEVGRNGVERVGDELLEAVARHLHRMERSPLTARGRGRMFPGTGDKGTALVMSERQPPDYGSEESVGDRTSE